MYTYGMNYTTTVEYKFNRDERMRAREPIRETFPLAPHRIVSDVFKKQLRHASGGVRRRVLLRG